ncbi:PASTA domain-containing protein [Stomatohabitans albus]|uniref:PASTA domain-containing protein n=1 Tax=Stomatohabitans albus TaxID=3110766 RepID=UPI00300D76E1
MRSLVALLIPLALLGSGCSLPVGAEEMLNAESSNVVLVPDLIGMDGVQAIITLREMGLTYRLHTSPNGGEGTVLNHLPKQGEPSTRGKPVELIIGGDQRVLDMIEAAAEPPKPEPEATKAPVDMDLLREELESRYHLDQNAVAKVKLPEIKGVGTAHTAPMPSMPATPPQPSKTSSSEPEEAPVEPTPVPISVDGSTRLDGPRTVNLGSWSLTLPGATTPYTTEVQGVPLSGYATRTANGQVIAAGCSTITARNGTSLPASMVDQLLLGAPQRYGVPERSGRYSTGHMPAVSSIVDSPEGKLRVVTWYGFGQLCDVRVPVDAQGRSDALIEPILESVHHN